jgi:hypothetical protein
MSILNPIAYKLKTASIKKHMKHFANLSADKQEEYKDVLELMHIIAIFCYKYDLSEEEFVALIKELQSS